MLNTKIARVEEETFPIVGEKSELNELLACPFCNGKVEVYRFLLDKGAGILCPTCGAVILFENKTGIIQNMNEVVKKWNARTS